MTYSLDNLSENPDNEPSAKRQKVLPANAPHTIAQNLSSSSYHKVTELIEDVKNVSQELLKPWRTQINGSIQDLSIEPSNLPKDALRLWAGILAFNKVLQRLAGEETPHIKTGNVITAKPELINGSSENTPDTHGEIVIKGEDESIDSFNTGQAVLTIFANTGGAPKQLFSTLQNPVKIGHDAAEKPKHLDDAVEIILPLKESALPNFVSVTRVPAPLENQKPKAKVITFGEKFGPPSNIPRLQPPKPSNRLVTKSTHVGWVSPEALSRQRNDKTFNERVYNWCSTRLSSSTWLKYNGVDIPKEPASPEERRRQRDRALSTGAPQPIQSVENKMATEKAKDDALFRDAFSSFAPTRDNSGAVVSEQVKSEIWWNRVGRQRAQRVFNDSTEQVIEDAIDAIDHDEEDKLFKEAVENIDPELLDLSIDESTHEADKEIDDLLQDINEQIETLYSYQRIRNSSLSSSTTPMTPVGQRSALTESIGTPTTPSTAENEVYKLLKTQLALLIMQLPPAAVTRLNIDKLDTLNISTEIVMETPNEAGILEDDTPKQPAVAHPAQIASRSTTSGAYGGLANQYTRQQGVHTPAALGPRSNSYYGPGQQRTASMSYQRPSTGPQSYAGGYPATGPRAGYNTAYNQSGFGQTPTRQSSNYYQQGQQTMAKNGHSGHSISTPQSSVPRYPQTPISYTRPTPSAQYGQASAATAQSPHYTQTTQGSGTPQYNRGSISGGRPSYFQGTASAASGPTGFHTSMTAQEQQSLMDRHRAQIAAQNQARLTAMGQASANMPGNPTSSYTTPSREGSGTPRPIAPSEQKSTVGPNGVY